MTEAGGMDTACLVRNRHLLKAVEDAGKAFRNGDADGAVKILIERGIGADPEAPQPYVELARLLAAAGRYDEALQVVPEMPAAADPVLKREIEAICRCALGDDAAAEQAARAAGERPDSLVVLGTLAARRGEAASAEAYFRRAIAADPGCGGGWLALGMLQWSAGNASEAWQSLRQAVNAQPLKSEAVAILCDMAQRLERCAEALAVIDAAAERFSDSRHLALIRIRLLACCGEEARSLEAAERFLVHFGYDDEVVRRGLAIRRRIGGHDHVGEGGDTSVSLCMIVKNEEASLARCLASCRPVVHEMVVVDTGSTDRTREIAAVFGAKVFEFAWNGDFSAARNFAADQAGGRWILVMDADEIISPADYESVRNVVSSSGKHEAWSVVTRNYTHQINAQGWTANDGTYPHEEAADGWKPSWKVRLFPNAPRFRFRGEVHEMVEQSLREAGVEIRTAPFVVHHYGELEEDPLRRREKQRRYYDIGMKKLAASPDDPAALAELAVQAGEIGAFGEAIELWNRLLAIRPDDVEALFNKGYCLMGLKRYPEALDVSRRAVKMAPGHKEAVFNYGTCELYAGKPAQAIDSVKACAGRYPDYPLLQALLAALLFVNGQAESARGIVRSLAERNYDIAGYLAQRADSLETVGRSAQAAALRAGFSESAVDGGKA